MQTHVSQPGPLSVVLTLGHQLAWSYNHVLSLSPAHTHCARIGSLDSAGPQWHAVTAVVLALAHQQEHRM